AHRRRHPFHRVHGAEQPAHRRQAGGVPLPLEQQLVAGAQVLPTLCQEQLGVLRQVHAQPSTRCTASSTREGWNGFTTKSFAPAWIASTTRACCPMALHIRIFASGSCFTISRTASIPPMSGITMSIVTRSGRSCLYFSTACDPASAARRSTTSSTVKPRTFLPAPTSRSTVVPPWVPLDAGGSGWRSARQPSTTVTSVPRTLTRPATAGGAPGMRVVASRGRISRTRSASAAHRSPPTRNTSRRTTPASLIRCEEAKILQGVALSKQSRVPRCAGQRGHQVGGPFGAHCHRRPGNRMVEREAGGVQQLAGREGFDLLRRPPVRGRHASTATVRVLRIAHHGVTDIRQ